MPGDGIITPYRTTKLALDIVDYFLVDPGIRGARTGADVASDIKASYTQRNDTTTVGFDVRQKDVMYWPSGKWTLRVVQQDITDFTEYTDVLSLVLDNTHFKLIEYLAGQALIAVVYGWRQNTDLPGMSYSAAIAASQDKFLVKRVPAGQSWNPAVPLSTATPVPPTTTFDIPLDRCGESLATYRADQGWFLRWTMTGTTQHYPGYIWSFYFGQYVISIKGNGAAILWEYCHDVNGASVIRRRAEFRYKVPPVGDDAQTLLIYPVKTKDGKRVIHFVGGAPDVTGFIGSLTFNDNTYGATPNHFMYQVNEVQRGGDLDESPGHVTKQGLARFDIRRDIKLKFQISKLGWATNGYLADLPFKVAENTHDQIITIVPHLATPAGTTMTLSVIDAGSAAFTEYAATGMDGLGSEFDISSTIKYVSPKFTFSGDGTDTPILYGYAYKRLPTADTGNATPFEFSVQSAHVEGFAGRVDEQGGEVTYEGDLTGAVAKLTRRGQFSARLYTTYSPDGINSFTVPLMRGYVYRPQGKSAGKIGATFPSPNWYRYGLPLVGMWFRLTKRWHQGQMKSFFIDPQVNLDTTTGAATPWKVTSIMQELLLDAGFPESQINIGPGTANDLDFRLWNGSANFMQDGHVENMNVYAEMIQRLATDYLGAALYWDDQEDYWSLIFAPALDNVGNFTPIFTFWRAPAEQFAGIPVRAPSTHASRWGLTSTFIANSFDTRPIPPEWNSVTVTTRVPYGTSPGQEIQTPATLDNYLSYKVPGSTIDPDPEHPDYLGTRFHIPIVDIGCIGEADAHGSIIDNTYRNCIFKARRFYDFACHGQQMYPFLAPLVFVLDPNTNHYRPLRYYDAITIKSVEGSDKIGVIRSVSPAYDSDFNQMAMYEAVVPRTGC